MKKLILATLLLYTQVAFSAVTIHSTGKGSTQEEAHRRAKINAVEGITGSFNLGHRNVRDNKYQEQLDDYVSGIIIESEVIDSNKIDGMWVVKIRAVVDETKPSTFEVQRDKPLFDERVRSKVSEMNNRKDMVQTLDSPGKLMFFNTNNIVAEPRHDVTRVVIYGTVQWQQKWVNDFENFAAYASNMNVAKKTINSNLYSPVTYTHPVFVMLNSMYHQPMTQVNPGQAYCFTDGGSLNQERCHNLGYELQHFPKFNIATAHILLKDSDGNVIGKAKKNLNELKMTEYFGAGSTTKDNWILFNSSYYFKTNTSVIKTNAAVPLTIDLTMSNDIASRVASYNIEIH
jgi:hypothetical protein